jgi:hypothetical protein
MKADGFEAVGPHRRRRQRADLVLDFAFRGRKRRKHLATL